MKPALAMPAMLFVAVASGCTGGPSGDTGPDDKDSGADPGDTGGGVDAGPVVWEDLRLETSEALYGLYPSGSGLYVVGTSGRSWLRSNNEWTELAISADGQDLNGLWGAGAEASLQMVTVGDTGWVGSWVDGAWNTEDVGTISFETVSGPAANDLVAAGWGGVYENKGSGWTYTQIDDNPQFNHIWYDGQTVAGVGAQGVMGIRTGDSWAIEQLANRRNLYGTCGVAADDIWAVGERGVIMHFDGATWTEQDVDISTSLWAVHCVSADKIYAVGNNGLALRYDGSAWSTLNGGVDHNLYAIGASAAGVVWAVGNRGMTLRLND